MAWYHRLRNTLRSERLSSDLDGEMEFHLAERIDELVATGQCLRRRRRRGRPILRVFLFGESLGAWTLVGCTVAPAFQFEGFELGGIGRSSISHGLQRPSL